MRKCFSLLFFPVFCFVVAGCARHSGSIKIGVAVPLTGPQSAIGRDVANAVKLAAEEFNANDKSGIKIEVAAYDDQSQVKEAANVANKLASDPECFAVIGHLVSGCSLPASEIYARAGLAMITPSSTNPQITLRGLANVFRTCPVDDVLGAGVAGVTLGSAPAGDAVTTPAPSITVTAPNAVRYRMTASSGETRPLLPPSRWAAGQPASRSRPSPWWATRLISANRSIAAAIPWSTDGRKPAGPTRK